MSNSRRQIAYAACRRDLIAFVQLAFGRLYPTERLHCEPYLEAYCYLLQQTLTGVHRKLVVTMPPRHLKSFVLTCFQAWLLGKAPTTQIMFVCYGEALARHHSDLFRAILDSAWYRELFPRTRINASANRQEEVATTAGGRRQAVTTGGAMNGMGADFIICDDLMKAQDVNSLVQRDKVRRFLDEGLFSRLNNPATGVLIAAQQRLHVDDIVVRLHEISDKRLTLPAIAIVPEEYQLYHGRVWKRRPGDILEPNRFSVETLEDIRLRNPFVFDAQYQQDPKVDSTALIDITKVAFVPEAPSHEHQIMALQFWDTAHAVSAESDYSVGVCFVFANRKWYLVDLVRGRFTFPALMAMAVEFARKWAPSEIFVENASSGPSLVQQLQAEGHTRFSMRNVYEPKEVRLFGQAAFMQSNRFAIVNDPRYVSELRTELTVFPHGAHDDIVDAITLGLGLINSRKGEYLVHKALNGGVRPRPRGRGLRRPSIYGGAA